MQIFLLPNKEGIKEWTIIELQGVLEFEPDGTEQLIGNLVWADDTAYLIITHNILEGKEVRLEKPLIVLSRNAGDDKRQAVTAVIKRKIVFKTRPKPLVLHSSRTAQRS